MIDERTERLINRKLDGELSSDEALELDKLLIRNPEARGLLASYETIDARAAEAIASVQEPVHSFDIASGALVTTASPRAYGRLGLGFVSGLAAAVACAFLLTRGPAAPSPELLAGRSDAPTVAPADPYAYAEAQPAGDWNTVMEGPRHETQQVEREVVGVFDSSSGSLYLLEMDRTASAVQPVKVNY